MFAHLVPLGLSLLAFTASAETGDPVELSLEPCINGGVSARGTYPLQSDEDVARAFAEGIVTSDNPYYVYMKAGRVVAPTTLVD
jgi:hypothetical protein